MLDFSPHPHRVNHELRSPALATLARHPGWLNAHWERFMRSLKEECVDRLIFFGESSLRRLFASSWSTITRNATTKAWAIA
jgi:hypothetical protein